MTIKDMPMATTEQVDIMNYDELSDFDINKRVAEGLGHKIDKRSMIDIGRIDVIVEQYGQVESIQRIPDYCNNPSDAWPIIITERLWIQYSPTEEIWLSQVETGHASHTFYWHENPLRAAMTLFLMMSE